MTKIYNNNLIIITMLSSNITFIVAILCYACIKLCCIWFIVSSIWFIICCIWFIVSSIWFIICCIWFIVSSIWFIICCIWFIVRSLWFIICGIWFVEIRFVVYGLLSIWLFQELNMKTIK